MSAPDIEAIELPEIAARQAIAEHFTQPLDLVPLAHAAPTIPAKRLHAPAANEAERNFERAQAVRESLRPLNDWAWSRAQVDNAHRIELNS